MIPIEKPISMYRGDYFAFPFRIRTRVWDPTANRNKGAYVPGAYRNLTGWSGIFQVKTKEDDSLPLAVGVVTIADQTLTPGALTFEMLPAESQKLIGGTLRYDVQLTDTNSRPRTYLYGPVTVLKDVSR